MTQDSLTNEEISLDTKPVKKKFFTKEMLHNGIFNVKMNMRLLIVLLVLHMAALPLTLGVTLGSILTSGDADADAYAIIAILTTCAAAIAGLSCATSAMPYLYKKSVVDMRLSLPMTTLQRYVSDYLSGLFVYAAPFCAADVVSLLLLLIGHVLCDGKVFYRYDRYSSSWECHIFEEAAPTLFTVMVGGIALLIMFYTLTVLVMTCCGSHFDSIAYAVLANGLIPGTIAVVIYTLAEGVYGLVAESYIGRTIPYTSPIGGFIGLIMTLEQTSVGAKMTSVDFSFGKWLIIFLAVTAVMAVGAYFIYSRRKAEDTGNPIVFSAFYHVIMTLGTVCISFLFMREGDIFVPMLIITAIIYFVFSVIRRRGFKKFWRSAVSYAVTMAVCCGSYFIIDKTDCFGAGKFVPSPMAVSKVYISYNGLFEDGSSLHFGELGYASDKDITVISETENIGIITDVHKTALDYPEDRYAYTSRGEVRIMYKMRTGSTVVREYPLSDEVILALSRLDMTDEMKQLRAEKARNKVEEGKLAYLNIKDRKGNCVELLPQWVYESSYVKYNQYGSVLYSNLPVDFYDRLGEYIYSDIMNETEEQYFREGDSVYKLRFVEYGDMLTVRGYYSNTIAYLKGCGFALPEQDSALALRMADFNPEIVSVGFLEYLRGTDIPTCTKTSASRSGNYMGDNGENSSIANYACLRDYVPELYTCLENSSKMYKSDEALHTITVNGNCAAVPMQYDDAAERLFITAVLQTFTARTGDGYYGYDSNNREHRNYRYFLGKFLDYYGKARIDEIGRSVYIKNGVLDISMYDAIENYVEYGKYAG